MMPKIIIITEVKLENCRRVYMDINLLELVSAITDIVLGRS